MVPPPLKRFDLKKASSSTPKQKRNTSAVFLQKNAQLLCPSWIPSAHKSSYPRHLVLPEGLPRLVTHHLGRWGDGRKGCHSSPICNHLVHYHLILLSHIIQTPHKKWVLYIYIYMSAVSAFGSVNVTHYSRNHQKITILSKIWLTLLRTTRYHEEFQVKRNSKPGRVPCSHAATSRNGRFWRSVGWLFIHKMMVDVFRMFV